MIVEDVRLEEVGPFPVDIAIRQEVGRFEVEAAGFEAVEQRGLEAGLAAGDRGLVAALLVEDRLGGLAAIAAQWRGPRPGRSRAASWSGGAAERAAAARSTRAWIAGSFTRKARSSSSSCRWRWAISARRSVSCSANLVALQDREEGGDGRRLQVGALRGQGFEAADDLLHALAAGQREAEVLVHLLGDQPQITLIELSTMSLSTSALQDISVRSPKAAAGSGRRPSARERANVLSIPPP